MAIIIWTLWWQAQLHWNVGPSARTMRSLKTGGISYQYSFQFCCIIWTNTLTGNMKQVFKHVQAHVYQISRWSIYSLNPWTCWTWWKWWGTMNIQQVKNTPETDKCYRTLKLINNLLTCVLSIWWETADVLRVKVLVPSTWFTCSSS